MSQSVGVLDLTFVAEADLSDYQYCVMTYGTAAGTCKKCGTSDTPIGVLQNAPELGEAASVRVLGTSKVKADGPFSKGDVLSVADANGEVDTVSSAPAHIIGEAMEAAGKAGVYVEMLVTREFVPDSIAPAALTAATTYAQQITHNVSGDLTASITAIGIGFARGAGTIDRAGFSLQNMGADGSDALSAELDILINGVSIFTTKPALAKNAADGASTFASGTGVTVGVIDEAANIVAAGDKITATWTLTRTSPEDEMADLCISADLKYKVGV